MLDSALRPLTEHPARAAILCDIDGTLAPITTRAEEARVPPAATRVLAELSRRYAVVACVSGRSALDAKRLAGVGAIAYAGGHGAELLWPGDREPTVVPEFARYAEAVHEFAAAHDGDDLRGLGVRLEDKGPIVAFHWRGAPDEDAAHARLEEIAAETDGLTAHWGRKVLEIRPPVPITKGRAVEQLIARPELRVALYGGDDTTDLDAFDALDAGIADGTLDAAVKVGVVSAEGPRAIEERADLAVQGPAGFLEVLHHL
ncbi:MAG TPA: trehalose-phosphatase [Thermoleophilaceae bacterium]|nr:trehalose-phosphatase [Thermoleophilaceae bacterium]